MDADYTGQYMPNKTRQPIMQQRNFAVTNNVKDRIYLEYNKQVLSLT